MSLKLNSSGGGSITLQEPSTASNRTLTLPDNTGNLISSADSGTVSQTMLASNVAGTGPAFAVFRNATQSVSAATYSKIQFNNEQFDTNNNFDSTTNYRFTPTVAGYYNINCNCYISGTGIGSPWILIYKNGSAYSSGGLISGVNISEFTATASEVVYMNGSTDYIEFYMYYFTGTGVNIGSTATTLTRASGALVRAA